MRGQSMARLQQRWDDLTPDDYEPAEEDEQADKPSDPCDNCRRANCDGCKLNEEESWQQSDTLS